MSLIDFDRIRAQAEISRANFAALQARIDACAPYQAAREKMRQRMPISLGGYQPNGYNPMWRTDQQVYYNEAKQAFSDAGIVIPDDYSVPWSTGQLTKGEGWHWDVIAAAAGFVVGTMVVLPALVGGGGAAAATGTAGGSAAAATGGTTAGSAAAAASTGVASTAVAVGTTAAGIGLKLYQQHQQSEAIKEAQRAAAEQAQRLAEQQASSSGLFGDLFGGLDTQTLLIAGGVVLAIIIARR